MLTYTKLTRADRDSPRVDRDNVQQAAETMYGLRVTGKFCFRTEKNLHAPLTEIRGNPGFSTEVSIRLICRYIASRAEPLVFIWSADDLDRGKDFGGHSEHI